MPSGDGSLGRSAASARGPPVEVAIRRLRLGDPAGAAGARPSSACVTDAAVAGGAGSSRRERETASWTFATRLSVNASRLSSRGRLGDEVEGALGERVDRARPVGGGEGGHDDHRDVALRAAAQRPQDAESVEARHRQVERHRVGALALAQRERLVAVAGAADHLDAGARQRAA